MIEELTVSFLKIKPPASKTVQWVKMPVWKPEFHPSSPHSGSREPTSASCHLTSTWTMWHRCDVRQTHKMNAENEEHFRESRKNMDDLAVKTSKKRKSWHENKK